MRLFFLGANVKISASIGGLVSDGAFWNETGCGDEDLFFTSCEIILSTIVGSLDPVFLDFCDFNSFASIDSFGAEYLLSGIFKSGVSVRFGLTHVPHVKSA